MERRETGAYKEILDHLDSLGCRALLANQAWLDHLASKEMLGSRGLKGILVLLGLLDCKEPQVIRVLLGLKDHRA